MKINNLPNGTPSLSDKIVVSDGVTGASENITIQQLGEVLNTGSDVVGVYRAILNQTGTNAPVATVIDNTLGGDIVWTYSTVGRYNGTLVGAFIDIPVVILGASPFGVGKFIHASFTSVDVVQVRTVLNDVVDDNVLVNQYIEIRVYAA